MNKPTLLLVMLVMIVTIVSRFGTAADIPDVAPPGQATTMPDHPASPQGPAIYSHTAEAGPDETFLLVGDGLTDKLTAWGPSDTADGADEFAPKVQFNAGGFLAATIPQKRFDGLTVVWAQNDHGFSRPVVLNAPQAWWVTPNTAKAGSDIEIFGNNLARRPDFDHAFVYALAEGETEGLWLTAPLTGPENYKHCLHITLPPEMPAGVYRLWCHAGSGGKLGWSEPLKLSVLSTPDDEGHQWEVPQPTEEALRTAIHDAVEGGGGIVSLAAGTYTLNATLKVPANVHLVGDQAGGTILRFANADPNAYALGGAPGWNVSPGGVSKPGDEMEYEIDAPADGNYALWLRYACDMSWWKQPGVSGNTAVLVDDAPPVTLENLPNTGGYEWYLWSRTAAVPLTKGKHKFLWRNVKGGGINIDAFVLATDESFAPSDKQMPVSGPKVIVQQAETAKAFRPDGGGHIPGRQYVGVWLCGDEAQIQNLTIQGNAQIDTGVLIRHEQFPKWIENCRVDTCGITGIEGKRSSENRGVHFAYARGAAVTGCHVWARAPIYFSGARQCTVRANTLVPQTRFGGGATGAIMSRGNILNQCVIADNTIASPLGREAGTPTVERMIWVSTGHGSVSENYFSNNNAPNVRFGGLPGSDQNVGETILLEACQRVAYHGRIQAADAESVTLPATIEPTPEGDLGTVLRSALAHDANGNETPFLPPLADQDDGAGEPTITEYYVTILAGTGVGQTRRASGRDGSRILLDRPWDCPPKEGDRVLVCTLFHRNLIVGNTVENGMSGIQLWYSCIENIVPGNTIRHERGGGLPLVAACTTLASSMPTMWNRGLAPCNFNTFEGNLTEDVTIGASISAAPAEGLHPAFPLAIGNVLRHNSLTENRQGGLVLGGSVKDANDPCGIVGVIAELNLVRNPSRIAYHVAGSTDMVVLRRNLAYFWAAMDPNSSPAAVQFDTPGTHATEFNIVEDRSGGPHVKILDERHAYKEAKGRP